MHTRAFGAALDLDSRRPSIGTKGLAARKKSLVARTLIGLAAVSRHAHPRAATAADRAGEHFGARRFREVPGPPTLRGPSPPRRSGDTRMGVISVAKSIDSKSMQRALSPRGARARAQRARDRATVRIERYAVMAGVVAGYPAEWLAEPVETDRGLVPFLTLQGKALADIGFKPGARFRVDQIGDGWLILSSQGTR